jgi:hypothetical protein
LLLHFFPQQDTLVVPAGGDHVLKFGVGPTHLPCRSCVTRQKIYN